MYIYVGPIHRQTDEKEEEDRSVKVADASPSKLQMSPTDRPRKSKRSRGADAAHRMTTSQKHQPVIITLLLYYENSRALIFVFKRREIQNPKSIFVVELDRN